MATFSGKVERIQGWRVFVKLDRQDDTPLPSPWYIDLPTDRCPELKPGMVVALSYRTESGAENNA